jgi:hypothetical protein
MFPPNITFASQNCNSLNVSTSCEKQIKKISSILSLYTTFIFLSDIRLGNTVTQEDIEKTFMCNKIKNYSLFHNSSRNKRGVGILIDKSIDYRIIDTYRDPDENILGLKICLDNSNFWVISVYGPNTNDVTFFDNIRNLIVGAGSDPIVVGGDWNATVCCLNSPDNIDTLYMAAPPQYF